MNMKLLGAAALGAAMTMTLAQSASAQTAPFGLTGAAPGVCVVSSAGLLGDSAVGKSVSARMKQLIAAANAEVAAEQTAVETEKTAIEASAKAATTPAQRQAIQPKAEAWQGRLENLQRKVQLRDAELQQTQAEAVGRIGEAARPLIRTVANSKGCGLVLDSNSVADANPAMDITAAVVLQLNTSLPSITFERKHLDTQAGAPQTR